MRARNLQEALLDLHERVRLRREVGLPALDRRREVANIIGGERRRLEAAAKHADAERIRKIEHVLWSEFRARFGPQFGRGLYDRRAVKEEALRRWRGRQDRC